MSDTVRWDSGQPRRQESRGDGANLADILERVLDKGIVIAGDIQVNLLDIELLTIKVRLVVASVDRAKEMGIDWWERDPTLSAGRRDLEDENARLRERVEALERSGRGELPPPDDRADGDVPARGAEDPEPEEPEPEDEIEDPDPDDEIEDGGPEEPDDDRASRRTRGTTAPARRRAPAARRTRDDTTDRRRSSGRGRKD